ncbi:hypothetical protein C8J56DRAFT_1051278 [Mycena floridula]|nr:hypothetical protein C8J56DRAFT_1051278 [Mycena floridula]
MGKMLGKPGMESGTHPGVLKGETGMCLSANDSWRWRLKQTKSTSGLTKEATQLIAYLDTLPESGNTPEQHDSIEDILEAAALDPDITSETSMRLQRFYAEFATKARKMRHKASDLKEEIERGFDPQKLDSDLERMGNIYIITFAGDNINKVMETSKHGPTTANEVRTDSIRKEAHRGNQSTISGGKIGDEATKLPDSAPLTPPSQSRVSSESGQSDNCPEKRHRDLTGVSEMPQEKPDYNQSVNSDLRVQSYLQVREAPEARERLLATLADIERHWGELAKFEAIEKRTMGPNRAGNLAQEPQDSDRDPFESEGKLDLTKSYSVSQGQSTPEAPNATVSESGGTEKENQRPDKETDGRIGFGESEMRDLVPCILGPESQFLKKHSYSAKDKVLLEMNLATRRSTILASSLPSLPVVSDIDETLENTGNNRDQQIPAMMAGIHGGSAHSFATALTSAPTSNAFQVAQQPRTEGYWVNMDSERDRTFTLVPTSRLIRSIDPDYAGGFISQHQPLIDQLQLNRMSKIEVFASRLVEQPACDLVGDANGQTSIFRATIIDRRMLVGKPVVYTPGFLVTAGNPSDEKARIIRQGNPLFGVLRGCIQDRRDEKDADMNLAVVPVVRDRTGWSNRNPQEFPLIELDVDYGRLHHITSNFELAVRNQLRQQIPDAVWQLGQGVLSQTAVGPRRNTTISLGCEILRQVLVVTEESRNQTHYRQPLRANPAALAYLTELLPLDQRETYITIVTVMVALHSFDVFHTPEERLFTIGPMSHVDLIARLSMELVPNSQLPEIPPYTEQQYQHHLGRLLQIRGPWRIPPQIKWAGMAYKDPIIEPHLSQYPGHLKMLMDALNRYQVYNLVADRANQFFLGNQQPVEGARAYAQIPIDEVLAKLPRNVVFTERERRPELEAVWRTEQWANYPKVVQLNLSARPDEVSHTPGFQPYLTRIERLTDLAVAIRRPIITAQDVPAIPRDISIPAATTSPDEARLVTVTSQTANSGNTVDVAPLFGQNAHGDDKGTDGDEMGDVQDEREDTQGRRNTTNGHDLTSHLYPEESSQRKKRANSLPLPLERLSLHAGSAPDVLGQESPQTSVETPITPQITSQHDVEREEGEISKLDDLDRLENLPRHSMGSSGDASNSNSRTALERQRELDSHFDGASGDEGRFKPTPNPLPPRHAKKPMTTRNRKPRSSSTLLGSSPNFRSKFPIPVGPPGLPQIPQVIPALPLVQVNSVFVDNTPSKSKARRKPPLPKLKRRAAEIDETEAVPQLSRDGDLVLGAIAGPSSHGSRMQVDVGRGLGGFVGGVLDFRGQEKMRRSFSSQVPSADESMVLRQIVLPEVDDNKESSRVFLRRRRSLDIALTDGRNDEGEEKVKRARHRVIPSELLELRTTMQKSETNTEIFVTELVSSPSLSPRSEVGPVPSPPSSSGLDEDMDMSSDDYTGQYWPSAAPSNTRDYSRPIATTTDPSRQPVIRGEMTLTQMYHFWCMYAGQVSFPDNQTTPTQLADAQFVQFPSAVRDYYGYRDHGKATIDEASNPCPERVIRRHNPELIPGPDHPLYDMEDVRRVITVRRSSLDEYPPSLEDFRLRIGRDSALDEWTREWNKSVIRRCKHIKHGMVHTRPSTEDYCMLDGNEDERQAEFVKDSDEFDRVQTYGWRECSVSLSDLPQVEGSNSYERPPAMSYELLEYVVPVNRDLAEATHSLDEQESMHLDRAPDFVRQYRRISDSATMIHESPHVFWIWPLRQARSDIQELIVSLVQLLKQRRVRLVLDRIPEEHPLKHYFRFHCVFFRIIEKGVSIMLQGYNVDCIHHTSPSVRYPEMRVDKYKPRNPLLLKEEDEFLFHAAAILEHFGMFEASNEIRGVRGLHLMRPRDIRKLLRHGYLDSLDHFDQFGQRTWAREWHDRS